MKLIHFKMAKGKTRDGLKISRLVKTLEKKVEDLTVRDGSKHRFVLEYPKLRPCPIAESTHVKYMVIPWLCQIFGYSAKGMYKSLQEECS